MWQVPSTAPGYDQFGNPTQSSAPPGYGQFSSPPQQQQFIYSNDVYLNTGTADGSGAYADMGSSGEIDQKTIIGRQDIDLMKDDEEPINGVVEKRTKTDTNLLISMAVFMILIIICAIICLSTTTERTILKDTCGNICGDVNEFNTCGESIYKSNEKFLAKIDSEFRCVAVCPEWTRASETKVCKNDTSEAEPLGHSDEIRMPWGKVACGMAISTAISIIMAMLFRYSTRGFVWATLIGLLVVLVLLTIYLWMSTGFNASNVIMLILTIGLVFVIGFLFKGIQFIIILFEETGKATWSMPALFLQPLLHPNFWFITIILGILVEQVVTITASQTMKWAITTLVSIITATILFIFLALATIKTDKIVEPSSVTICDSSFDGRNCEYDSSIDGGLTVRQLDMSTFQAFSLFLIFVGFIWIIQFIVHCQYYITANAISFWFFTRDKLALEAPIKRSYRNLWKYHLGTIAFGSLVITAVQLLRYLIKHMKRKNRGGMFAIAAILDCCVSLFERFLVYLTRNAYVITAIHGYGYWKSGEKAFHYLTSNLLNILRINELGASVLYIAQLFIVVLTVCVGVMLLKTNDIEDLGETIVGIVLLVIFSWITTSCFISIIDMTVDTLYICFCVDCKHNNGEDRPYFMSVSMMEFMEVNKRFAIEKEDAERIKNGLNGTAV